MNLETDFFEVEIPKISNHEGLPENLVKISISKFCPKCGAARAKRIWKGFSYDGSRRLQVDCWENECSHIDEYRDVLLEAVV